LSRLELFGIASQSIFRPSKNLSYIFIIKMQTRERLCYIQTMFMPV
jgi:hypothetical protein